MVLQDTTSQLSEAPMLPPTVATTASLQASPRRRWLRRTLLGFGAVFSGFVVYILIPGRIHREAEGWRAEVSYRKYGCRFCLSHVDQLDSPAGAVIMPQMPDSGKRPRDVYLVTPVGTYFSIPSGGVWHIWHGDFRVSESREPVRSGELEQGFYHLPLAEAYSDSDGRVKKAGTPANWCMMSFGDTRGAWWLRPDQVNHFPKIVADAGLLEAPKEDGP